MTPWLRSDNARSKDVLTDALLAFTLSLVGFWILLRLPDETPGVATGRAFVRRASDFAWLLVISAPVILLARAAGRLARGPAASPRLRTLALLALPAALSVFLLSDRIGATKAAMMGEARYFWLDDDVMISMRYARNLAHGHGLVWNADGPRVEGYTNFLWTMLLSLPHLARLPARLTSAAVILATSLIHLLVLVWTARVGSRMKLSPACIWIALLLLASNRWMIHWTAGGSEMILLALLSLAASERLLSARRGRPEGVLLGLILGSIGLVRADGFVLMAGFLPLTLVLIRSGRVRPSALILGLGLPLAHAVLRRLYYDAWLPNTYALKVLDMPMKEAMGVEYTSSFFSLWAVVCVLHLLWAGLTRSPRIRWLALVPWIGVGYATLIGGDELPEYRLLVPYLPLFLLGAAGAAQRIFIERRASPIRSGVSAIPGAYGWFVIALMAGTFQSICLPNALEELGTRRSSSEENNVRIGLLLRANTDPEARIAHFWAGAAAYFSERPAQDMLGKNDRGIASRQGHQGQWLPGHTKYDASYSLGLEPDVIVTARPGDRLDPLKRDSDLLRWSYPALFAIYEDPVFQKDYAPGLVPLEISDGFHAI
ncbi:hypothetical protein IIC65_04515, partial [Candidatus Sumerlaeota bacterium]|nr:hypothetical protein [Candidatus Sumerlaeota bacterium]